MKAKVWLVSACVVFGISSPLFQAGAGRAAGNGEPVRTESPETENTPEQIRSLISRMKEQMEKDTETFPELIKETEQQAARCTDPTGAAVLHSMLAEMYRHYYGHNGWQINRRTELSGYVPDDIREWTASLFNEKITAELEHSLQPAELLQQTSVSRYAVLLKTGKDDSRLRPTLYDFLARRAIDMQPDGNWYERLLAFRKTQPQREALLQTELDYRQALFDRRRITAGSYLYALDSLSRLYKGEDDVLTIRTARLWLLKRTQYQGNEAHRDSVTAEIYTLCKETAARYPDNERANTFRNTLSGMENPFLNVQAPKQVYPGETLKLKIQYQNVPQVTVRIYKSLLRSAQAWQKLHEKSKEMRGTQVEERTFRLLLPDSYTEHDTTLTLPVGQLGLYEYEIVAPDKQIYVTDRFCVSRLAVVTRRGSDLPEVFVADLKSGKPVEGGTVLYYLTNMPNGDLRPQGQVTTDRFGIAQLPTRREGTQYSVRPVYQNDTAATVTSLFVETPYLLQQGEIQLSLFTDRSLYRPGQTVSFKGIAYVKDVEHPHIAAHQRYTVSLRDVNGKEVANRTFETNRFGSFDGEFTLPEQTLNGLFSLQTEKASVFFRVEAYKRPSFKIDFLPLKEEVAFGHPVVLEGEAQSFSGIALQEGEVKWTVVRCPFWSRSFMSNPFNPTTEQVSDGTSRLDGNGKFTLSFTPVRPETMNDRPAYQSYEVRAVMTDSKGETQETSYLFSVGDTGLLLSVKTSGEEMNKDSVRITVRGETVNRQPVAAQGHYSLYSLSEKADGKDIYGTDHYPVDRLITVGTFQTDKPLAAEPFRLLPSGRYRIEVKATDTHGKEVSAEQDFILYGSGDVRPPVFRHEWLITEKTDCLPGEEAVFVFGTSDPDTYILYEVYDENRKRTKRELLRMNNENRTFRIPFRETDGKGFTVSFTFIKEGALYEKKVPVTLRRPDRKLTIHTETFRDKLLPGSKEQWVFRIADADSVPAAAEVLAGMYDASLDRLYPSRWHFTPEYLIQLPVPYFYEGSAFHIRYMYETGRIRRLTEPDYSFSVLDWQDVMGPFFRSSNYTFPTGMVELSATADNAALHEPHVQTKTVNADEEKAEEAEGGMDTSVGTSPQLRGNFAETAFFYPVLVTDTAGRVAFRFTMPESNTTWKLQLLAHTEELKYGYLSKETVTGKPLMVTPNLPRFFREGDEVCVTAQISNLTDGAAGGTVRLELFDPETGTSAVLADDARQTLELPESETVTVRWRFHVPAVGKGLIGCRIIAETDKGSDGEQHLLPVFSREIPVTESTPIHLFDKQEATVRLQGGKDIRPFRTTLEITSNPVWYAVQALPTIAEPENDNAVSWFAAYYSSTLAEHIANTHPRIRQIIRQWEAQDGDANTLRSDLQKNEELKGILLQETPWVLDAENEQEQKQRLSLLFDPNRTAGRRAAALRQLLDLQTGEGGWSWFKGMRPSTEITDYILRGMAQLVELNAVEFGQEEKEMLMRALRFTDKRVADRYREDTTHTLTPWLIDYLFVRSAYRDIPEPADTREAVRCYTELAGTKWEKQDLYRRGEIAWLMHRNGNSQKAAEILAWFRKTATVSGTKGMYWANNRLHDGFFFTPTDTHCLLMGLFKELESDTPATDRMKQWLLSQKQTRHWGATPTTANAIYALLLTGSDWLAADNRCTARWGDQTYHTEDGETATGYLKVVRTGKEAAESAGSRIVILKEGDAPAWGAVYEQYFRPIDKVRQQKGGLNVEKKLFIEENDGDKPVLRALQEGEDTLRVGDKVVVRLVVRTDRDMDYVFLKDLRPGCAEPAGQLSGTKNRDGVWFYQSPTDVAEHFFFDRLPEGTFVLEYAFYVSRTGTYAGGISTIQCLYAPTFVSHTEGTLLHVE